MAAQRRVSAGSTSGSESCGSETSCGGTPCDTPRGSGRSVLWQTETETRRDVLQLVDDDRILERIQRRSDGICCCLMTNVHREHIRIPVDSITRIEAVYAQQAKTRLALKSAFMCVTGVTLMTVGGPADDVSDLSHSDDGVIPNWVGPASLIIGICLMCAYLNSMKGGMLAKFYCADRAKPITVAFPLVRTYRTVSDTVGTRTYLTVSDAGFDADGEAAGKAMQVVRKVEAARAMWHTSGALV